MRIRLAHKLWSLLATMVVANNHTGVSHSTPPTAAAFHPI